MHCKEEEEVVSFLMKLDKAVRVCRCQSGGGVGPLSDETVEAGIGVGGGIRRN